MDDSLLGGLLLLLDHFLLLALAVLHEVERGLPICVGDCLLKAWIRMISFCLEVRMRIFSMGFCVGGGVRRSS
jgi:hypothetical protein